MEVLDLPALKGKQFSSMAEHLTHQTANVLGATLPLPLGRCIPHASAAAAPAAPVASAAASGSVVYDANRVQYGEPEGPAGPMPPHAIVNGGGYKASNGFRGPAAGYLAGRHGGVAIQFDRTSGASQYSSTTEHVQLTAPVYQQAAPGGRGGGATSSEKVLEHNKFPHMPYALIFCSQLVRIWL